jgi:tRNA (guanine-N7-)-methyltransferase
MQTLDWYSVEQLPWPVDWAAEFGRAAPLLMEIGFGSGQFLSRLARERPEADILGVEISLPSLRNAAQKVAKGELANVRLLHASAQAALTLLCPPQSLSEVYINYPDPWPKKAHNARRLISGEFLALLASRMIDGGRLDISTDHADYAAAIDDCLAHTPYFTSRRPTSYSHDAADRVGTKYEQVALKEGRRGHYFRWGRNAVSVDALYAIPKEQPMPHVVLRAPVGVSALAARFQPRYVELDGAAIKYLEAYQSLHDGKLLVETFVNEEPLKQHICLAVRERTSGDLIVEMHDIGFPRPTAGIHQAIRYLADWIIEEYPATVIAHSNLLPER